MKFYSLIFIFFLSIGSLLSQQKGLSPIAKTSTTANGTTFALIVGISNYEDERIPDLKYAHRDAEAFASYLKSDAGGNLPDDKLTLYLNENATGANIHKALYTIVKDCKEGDNIIFYFSGHGDVETIYEDEPGHLLVHDTPANIYQINSLRIDDLKRIVSTMSNQKKAKVKVFLDACRSGKLAGSEVKGSQATAAALTNQFANEVKIMSCQPNEFSLEGEEWGGGRGIFSYYMIEGLIGLADTDNNETVSLKELERYLEDRFDEDSPTLQQTPMVLGDKNTMLAQVDAASLDKLYLEKNIDQGISAENQLVNAKGIVNPEEDSLQLFYNAIANNELLTEFIEDNSSTKSAQFFFAALSKSPNYSIKTPILKGDFIAALQNDAQHAINKYLSIDSEEMNKRWAGKDQDYNKYNKYLTEAANLMGESHYMWAQLKAKSLYFDVVTKRLNLEKQNAKSDEYEDLILEILEALIYQPRSPFIYNELGLIYHNQKKYEKAILEFEKAIEMSPTWALPVANIANANYYAKNYEKGEEYALKAIGQNPKYAAPYAILANVYYSQGNFQKSLEYDLLANDLNPRCDDLSNIALKYLGLNNNEKAREYVEKALKCNPNFKHPYMVLGDILRSEGKNLEAIDTYELAVSDSKLKIGAYWNIALSYTNINDFDQAILYYKKIKEIDPNHQTVEFLAAVQLKANKLDDAKVNFEYYIKNINPDNKWAYFDLACVYAKMNNLTSFKSNMLLAIDKGFTSKKEMEESIFLSSIKSSKEYIEILELLTQ
jgi:tetratricopeptide (TPR) repeat protein